MRYWRNTPIKQAANKPRLKPKWIQTRRIKSRGTSNLFSGRRKLPHKEIDLFLHFCLSHQHHGGSEREVCFMISHNCADILSVELQQDTMKAAREENFKQIVLKKKILNGLWCHHLVQENRERTQQQFTTGLSSTPEGRTKALRKI